MAERLYTTPITSRLSDRLEQQVTDEAAAASRNSHRCRALCGKLFVVAPLVVPTVPGLRGGPGDRVASSRIRRGAPAAPPPKSLRLLHRGKGKWPGVGTR